jgi:DNA polymerase-4
MIGIRNPLEMRHASVSLLRKAFGGIVGDYWHRRLNFGEVDLYSSDGTRTMSATRTMSSKQAANRQALESMLIALCTRLEQRMVKNDIFCKGISVTVKYKDGSSWDTTIKLADPLQDAMEMRGYIQQRIHEFSVAHNIETVFTPKTSNIGVAIYNFVDGRIMQYSLFDNKIKKDLARKVIYNIKDRYGKNTVRKGSELFVPDILKDAIGFGSVKDMSPNGTEIRNKYMLEEDGF